MDIDYFSKVMAELFHQHNYRGMYEFWLEKIKPELEFSKKREEWLTTIVKRMNDKISKPENWIKTVKETKDE